jgi:hypothetical protein
MMVGLTITIALLITLAAGLRIHGPNRLEEALRFIEREQGTNNGPHLDSGPDGGLPPFIT